MHLLKSHGNVKLLGEEIKSFDSKTLRNFYKYVQIVLQNPHASINPRWSVREILKETEIINPSQNRDGKKDIGYYEDILERVGLRKDLLYSYANQLSGGEKQRVCIARALALNPKIIIFDEPTASLDKTAQKQVLELLLKLQKEYSLGYIFITHDLHIVEAICDSVVLIDQGVASNIEKEQFLKEMSKSLI